MDFEAIPLYNKIILGPATSEEVQNVTNKHVLQKQKKMYLEDQKRRHKKCTVHASTKGLLKKKINE